MKPRTILCAVLLAAGLASNAVSQTLPRASDDQARLGRFQPPPPPPPLPPPVPPQPQQSESDQVDQDGQQPRRPWREMTDALLDMMAARLLLAGGIIDDPLTTGFGNSDFLEPKEPPPDADAQRATRKQP